MNFSFERFELDFWKQIFLTAIHFVTQTSGQLDKTDDLKRKRIIFYFCDMPVEMTVAIRKLWYSVGNNKHEFVPFIIGPMLRIALIKSQPIRRDTINIFFDMYYSCFDVEDVLMSEFITHLDDLITIGHGDFQFLRLFQTTFIQNSKNHPEDFEQACLLFVEGIVEQCELLLNFKEVVQHDCNEESLMSSIIDTLNFYDKIDRREMYIRYLNKLYDLHIKCENFVEAAYTLSKHAVLLEWSDKSLETYLQNDKYNLLVTHRELKEKLYKEIIDNFNVGQLWEAGIVFCKEQIEQYEFFTYDYSKLPEMFKKLADFYNSIVTSVRVEPEYFFVFYHGKGFPECFQNKMFIYRGKGYERLVDFTKRLKHQFPKAKVLNKLDQQDEELFSQTNEQMFSIFKVNPVINETVKNKFNSMVVDEKIMKYYQVNQINQFVFSRPLFKDVNSPNANEFSNMFIERTEFKTIDTLPNILCRSEVIFKKTYELNPLENAIDTMRSVNDKTCSLISEYLREHKSPPPLHILIMHVNGIINSDVQGGISKYEQAFFNESNSNYREEDLLVLKQLIADQIPLLEMAIQIIHAKQTNDEHDMSGLVNYIAQSFETMREHVEQEYGKRDLPVSLKCKQDKFAPTLKPAPIETSPKIEYNRRNSFSVHNT